MLDKGRAVAAGTNGEYHYDCGLDQHIVKFLNFDPKALFEEIKAGKSDTEILEWLKTNAKTPRTAWEIEAWSAYQDKRGPDGDPETLNFFAGKVAEFTKEREDITTWFGLLDVDDYVSFGGKA